MATQPVLAKIKKVCKICSEEHHHRDCQNREHPKCNNCQKAHAATFKGCPTIQKEFAKAEIKKVTTQHMVSKAAKPTEALCMATAFDKVLTTLGHNMDQNAVATLCNDITMAVNLAYKTNIEGAHVAHLAQLSNNKRN